MSGMLSRALVAPEYILDLEVRIEEMNTLHNTALPNTASGYRGRQLGTDHPKLEVLTVDADGERAIMFYEPFVASRLRLGATWSSFKHYQKNDVLRFFFKSVVPGLDTHLDVALDKNIHSQLWHGFTRGKSFFIASERVEKIAYNVPVVRIAYDEQCSRGLAQQLADTLRENRLRYLDVVA